MKYEVLRILSTTQYELSGGWKAVALSRAVRALEYVSMGALLHIGWSLIG
jgi:hypothetical protein